jgi:hypothetical protein
MAIDDPQKRAILAVAHEKLALLNPAERASLLEVGKPLGRNIADTHRDVLTKAGLVKQGLGGLVLTDIGKVVATLARI